LVDPPHEHHPHGRAAVGRGGGERGRLGLGHPLGARELVPVEDRRKGPAHAHIAIATYLVSRYSAMPSRPPSRPKPDALTPPNGAAGFDTRPVFRPTMPTSSAEAKRIALSTLSVHT